MDSRPEELTVSEAVRRLGLSRRTVESLCAAGMLPARQSGSRRARVTSVDAVVAVAAERDRRRQGAAVIREILDGPVPGATRDGASPKR